MDGELCELNALEPKQLTGNEPFSQVGVVLPQSIQSFWRWAYSNLAANNLRGHLAEFIVASDLGVADGTRVEWDDCDLWTKDGHKIEVKSAAYLQSWKQSKHSAISFGIAPSYGWDTNGHCRIDKPVRNSDAYVFCLLGHKEKRTLDPLNLDQWEFFVLATNILDKELGPQKTLSLGALRRLQPIHCRYGEIANTVRRLLVSA
jgi:hypothetical protein